MKDICVKIIDFRAKGISPGVLSKVFLIGMLASAWMVQAAGLGKLTVSSYFGQPLNAEIALESVTDKEIDSLSARLASPKIFQKTGVNLAPYHATLSVSVEKRADGRPYIRISSSQAINEPFLNLLIELSSSSGHLLREYNVLLDPAETQKAASAEPVVQSDRDKTGSVAATTVPGKTLLSVETTLPPAQTGGIYGPVIRGDTLSRIARQVSPDSVNLNQVLVALYRANRDAFLERNMNLLKVGVILRIPDESEISSVTTKEASREIAVQKESWNDYRQKIADLADNFSEKSDLKQSQTGKITTVSGESSVIGSNKSEEVLILSKGELLSDNHLLAKKAEDRTAQNYLYMMEEDAIAKERALQEANERVAILEQNVAKLQRLLELKGSTLESKAGIELEHTQHIPDLQAISTPAKQADIAVVGDSAETLGSVAGASENSTSPITIPAQSVKPASLSKPLQPVSPESGESDLMDTLLQHVDKNSKWAAAGLGVLLVIALGASLIFRKRKQFGDPDSSDIYDYAEKDDKSMSSGMAKITSVDEHIEKPDEELIQRTVSTSESGDFNLTDTAGNQADVDLDLFFGGKQEEKATKPLFFTADSVSQTYAENETTLDESNELNNEIKTSTIEPDPAECQKGALIGAEEDVERKEDETSKQWIFTSYDDALEEKSDLAQAQDHSEVRASSHDAEHQIDFDLKLSEEKESTKDSQMMDELPELSSTLANIDLDLGDEPGEKPQAVNESSEVGTDMQWREVATKLDLARAYLEMDDNEGARDILEEVLREGDHEQQSAARFMLDKIS